MYLIFQCMSHSIGVQTKVVHISCQNMIIHVIIKAGKLIHGRDILGSQHNSKCIKVIVLWEVNNLRINLCLHKRAIWIVSGNINRMCPQKVFAALSNTLTETTARVDGSGSLPGHHIFDFNKSRGCQSVCIDSFKI